MVLLYNRNLFYCNVKRKGKPFMDYLSVVTVIHLWWKTGKKPHLSIEQINGIKLSL